LWLVDGVEVTIDTWPWLSSFVEVEGEGEDAVRKVAEKIGFLWEDAVFGAVDVLYCRKYGISVD